MQIKYLPDLCENLDFRRKPITGKDRVEGEIPYYGASGVVDYVDGYIFDEELLLVSEDGANLLARSTPIAFSIKGKTWVNNHAHVLKFSDKLIQKYVELYLNSISLEPYVTGSAQPKLNQKRLNEIPIPLPEHNKMSNIIEAISQVDELIALRKEQLAKLDQLVKSRFIELFGDPVTNSMGWNTNTVANVCDNIYGGGTPSKSHPEYYENGDIPWVSSKDMKTDILYDSQIKINQLGVDNSTAKMVPINSVIMVIRSGILKHTLPVAINAVPITVNQDLKVFIPSEKILSIFLMYQFKMLEKDILSGVRAVTADNIEFDSLKKREIIVPPMELQEKFASFVEQTDKSKLAIQQSLDKLELLKKALMQEYFG